MKVELPQIDQFIRCIKNNNDDMEAWFANIPETHEWMKITIEKATLIIDMVSDLDVETALEWCRVNCWKANYNPSRDAFCFERKVS